MPVNQPTHDAYVIKEGKNGKEIWTKIGVVFEAKNDTLVLELHAHPIGSRIILRPHKPARDYDEGRRPASSKATPSRLPRTA